MPRGRPRKNHVDASPSNPEFDGVDASVSVDSQPAVDMAPAGRPSKNRIAVRRFGAASDQDYEQVMPGIPSTSQGRQQQPLQQPGGGYVLIHKSFWNDVCVKLACSSCGKRTVQMKTEKLSGLASKLIMYCTACGVVLSQVTSSPEDDEGDHVPKEEPDFEVNKKFVKFFVSEGKSFDDVVVFSKTLGIPVISKSMFEKYRDELLAVGS